MGTLRLLLALSVVLFHSGPFLLTGTYWVGGIVAVECFFLISGFYIALILSQRYRDGLRNFYWNRFIRIFPLYWAVLALYVLAGAIEPGIDRFAALRAIDPSWGTVLLMGSANLLLFGSDLMLLFSSGPDGLFFVRHLFDHPVQLFRFHYVPQAWSLPIELVFYALAPWLVLHPRRLLLVGALSLAGKYTAVLGWGLGDPWMYRFLPFEFWLFCLGALSFHAYAALSVRRDLARLCWPAWWLVGAAVVFYAIDDPAVVYSITAWRYAGMILGLAILLPVLFAGFKDATWDRWLGELSYPIYLVHLLVVGVVKQFGWHLGGDQSVLILLGSVAVAVVLVYAVGRPVERHFKRVPVAAREP